MISKIFIIGPGGILCYSKDFFSKVDKDDEIVSGYITAVSDFAREIKGGKIESLIFKNFKLVYSYSIDYNCIFVIVIDKDDSEQKARMNLDLMKSEFIERYRAYLENWTGIVNVFHDFDDFVEENIYIPPEVLLTGEKGVGKTTIMNFLPGEVILELDDNFNEIIQKTIKISGLKGIKECLIRSINLNNLIDHSDLYKEYLNTFNIICIITNSGATNLGRTKRLYSLLVDKVHTSNFYVLANFQDEEDAVLDKEQISEMFELKTFSFSAVQTNANEYFLMILKEMLRNSVLNKPKSES
jgi:Cdc6-like AAA superfamily ATPase